MTNAWVRFTLESFIDVVFAGILAVYSPRAIIEEGGVPKSADKFAFACAILSLMVCGFFFALVWILTFSDFKKSSEHEHIKKKIFKNNRQILYYEHLFGLKEQQNT